MTPFPRLAAATDVSAVLLAIVLGWLLTSILLYPALELPDNVPMILRPILGFACVLLLLRWRGGTLGDLGLVRQPLWRVVLAAALLLLALGAFERFAAPPLAGWIGVTPQTPYLMVIRGNTEAFLFWLGVSWVVGGFMEELLFRGFLLRRMETMLGGGRAASTLALFAQAGIFGLLHLYAGAFMAVLTACFSLIFGLAYLLGGRKLWPLILAHGAWNTFAIWSIYRSSP